MNRQTKHLYEFGAYCVDPANRLLLRDGAVVPLAPKAFDLLLALIEESGQVLAKEELMQRVWPGVFVEEANLSNHVFTLRKALGEDKSGKRYIETIPRRGYRFVAEVAEISDTGEDLIVREQAASHIVIEQTEETSLDVQPVNAGQSDEAKLPPSVKRLAARPERRIKLALLMSAVAVIMLGLAAYLWMANRAAVSQPANLKSIAVLPFKPLVAESHDEYLELGMADTLITKLSSLKQIVVRPTSAVRRYTDLQQDAIAAGRELQVEAVLEGGIQRLGDRLRVTVRLVNTHDGATIWADKFDERFTDIFAVQDAISHKLASALALKLVSQGTPSKRHTTNLEAYQLYLKGRYYWNTFKEKDLETSVKFFNAALEKDPAYALAYSGLANVYSVRGLYGPMLPQEAYPKSKAAALEALRLDDQLAEAHASLGAVMIFYDRDWPGAEQELKRARELDPNCIDSYSLYGYCLQAMGRGDDAIAEMRRAHEIDPVWPVVNNNVANALYFARRYDEAINYAQESLKLDPNPRMFCIMGLAYLGKGMPELAIAAFQQALSLKRNYERAQAGLGCVYARLGKRSEALDAVRQLKENQDRWIDLPSLIATIYAALGEKDQAFVWLEKAVEDRNPHMWQFKLDPQFDSLRTDERFIAFLRRINLES